LKIHLSKQDPRELPKGSRDPLGFEILWTQYGRRIIGNLTTITGSIEEFLTTEMLSKELEEAGFEMKYTKSFSMGISTLLVAQKK